MLTGEDHGLGICLVVSEYPPGAETPSHRHPTGSAIVVVAGHGAFTVGDSEVGAGAGDIVVIPADAWHSFRNDGDEWLRLVGVDEGARLDAELAPSGDA
jgi:quercetin dioxygenase-like cupin family protein